MGSKACSDKKSRLSALIGFHQKCSNLFICNSVFSHCPIFGSKVLERLKECFFMLISPRVILPSHSLVQSHLLALLLLYLVQTPHLQSAVRVCSWQSHFSFILFNFFNLSSHLEFPLLFLVQQVNILIFTSQ